MTASDKTKDGGSSLRDTHRADETAVVGWKAPRWPKKGTRLRFLGKNGYDFQLVEALRVLNAGAVYTCTDCSVGDWEHSVALENVPGRFNGVMFEMVAPDDAPASDTPARYEPEASEPKDAARRDEEAGQ
jgi:hypothetical protein